MSETTHQAKKLRRRLSALLATAKDQAEGGDVAAALASIEEALKIEPSHVLARQRLGRLLVTEGNHERAEALWSGLLDDAPEEARTRLARIHEARGDRDTAIGYWQALLELPGEHPGVEARIAHLRKASERAAAAARRKELADLLATAVKQAEGGDGAAAIASLERALEIDPEHLLTRTRLARLLTADEHQERAAAMWSDLVDEAPVEAHGHLARSLEERGEAEAALTHWQALLELPGNHVEAHTQMARWHAAQGDEATAIVHWQALLDLTGSHVEARAQLARLKGVPFDEVDITLDETPQQPRSYSAKTRKAATTSRGQQRMMLNLMILGARRSATTSLGYYLMEHPEIYHVTYQDFDAIGGLRVNYPYNIPFSALTDREATLDAYRAVTPERPPGKDPASLKYILNRVVYAIYNPHILFNLAEHLPDVKILMSLRNPADSLFSGYCKMLQEDRISGSFEEAILNRMPLDRPPSEVDLLTLEPRIARGIYYPGVDMVLKLFPREQIHIVSFNDLTRRTAETMKGICRFLEIDEGYDFNRLSVVRGLTEKPAPMSADTRRWLDGLYGPHNQKLFELLGWPADSWGGAPK